MRRVCGESSISASVVVMVAWWRLGSCFIIHSWECWCLEMARTGMPNLTVDRILANRVHVLIRIHGHSMLF